MRSLSWSVFLVPCALALFGLSGCGQRSAAPKQVTQASRASEQEMNKIVASSASATAPTSAPAPSPTTNERLAQALNQLGAQHGPRGEILPLPNVGFAAGRAHLNRGNETELEQIVTLLRDYPKTELIIDGYTDNRGSEQLNGQLSLKRAKAVREALVAHGLNAARVRTRGLGSANPIADNHTREGRDKNRRVELVFSNSAGTFASVPDQNTAG